MTGEIAVRAGPGGLSVQAVAMALLVLPWLWPLATGPSAAVLPWLVSAACAALLIMILALDDGSVNWSPMLWQALLIAALASSAIGLLQYFGASHVLEPWINVTHRGHAYGNLRQPNQFASLTGIGLAVILWGRRGPWRPGDRCLPGQSNAGAGMASWASLAAVVLLAVGNAASASRTGLLHLFLLVVLAMCWRSASQPGVVLRLLLAVVAYSLASIALPLLAGLDPLSSGITGRFGDSEQACGSRRLLWSNVLQLIALKPWWGWGWGELDYAHFIALYPGERFCDILDNAHNLPLHLAVELGVPFAVLVCGLIIWLVLRARPWRETAPQRQLAWAVLALIGLHSMLEYPLWYGPFQIATGLALWLLWRTRRRDVAPGLTWSGSSGDGNASSNAGLRFAILTGATLALAALAYGAWDYHRVSQIYRAPELRDPAYRVNTLAKLQDSWLFRNQVRFAALTLSTVHSGNAQQIHDSAQALMHFSPEARVVEKLIESATALNRDDEATYFLLRYRNAYPKDHARWRASMATDPQLAPLQP